VSQVLSSYSYLATLSAPRVHQHRQEQQAHPAAQAARLAIRRVLPCGNARGPASRNCLALGALVTVRPPTPRWPCA
jgi:hypothetical protein